MSTTSKPKDVSTDSDEQTQVTAEISGSFYKWLGRDAAGRFHHYDKSEDTVYISESEQERFLPDGAGVFWFRVSDIVRVEHMDDYDGLDVDDWEVFVADDLGWDATPTNLTATIFGAVEGDLERDGGHR